MQILSLSMTSLPHQIVGINRMEDHRTHLQSTSTDRSNSPAFDVPPVLTFVG